NCGENDRPSIIRLFSYYARFNKFVKHITSCRLEPSGPAPLLFEFLNRLLFRKQAVHPDLSSGSRRPPVELQCRNLNTFLPKFQRPVQMKNCEALGRPLKKVPGLSGMSVHSLISSLIAFD